MDRKTSIEHYVPLAFHLNIYLRVLKGERKKTRGETMEFSQEVFLESKNFSCENRTSSNFRDIHCGEAGG